MPPKPHTKGHPSPRAFLSIWVPALHILRTQHTALAGEGETPSAQQLRHATPILNAGTLCRSTSYLNHEDSPTSQAGALPFFPRGPRRPRRTIFARSSNMTEWLHICGAHLRNFRMPLNGQGLSAIANCTAGPRRQASMLWSFFCCRLINGEIS